MGSFGKTTQTTSQTNNPWAKQSPFLEQGFNAASSALNQAQGAPRPDQFVSQFDPNSLNIFKRMMGYGNSDMDATSAAVGQTTAQAGAQSLVDSFKRLNGWTPTGGPESNIAAATQYANNPAVSGMVDSAMRGAQREADERIMPGISRGAAASGNLNSSKTELRRGVVDRALVEKRADIESDLRGSLYDQGLKMAEGARQYDNDSVLKAVMANLSGGNAAVGTGVGATSAGVDQARGLFDLATGGIQGAREVGQAPLDEQMAKYKFGTQAPFDALNNFWNIVGSNSWGGTSNGTATSQASPAQMLGGLMMAGGSLFGKKF
jgi:hypothetical protein